MTAGSPYSVLDSAGGKALLDALADYDEQHAAAAAKKARTLAPTDVAAAALATTFARHRARASGKFEHPDRMLFTRVGYEQASSSAVARHRSSRFQALQHVVDLCCGVGADTIALANAARRVTAVDVEADALACAEHNAGAFGVVDRVQFVRADALTVSLGTADAVFADPSRRSGDRRAKVGSDYAPPLFAVIARAREVPEARLCVKAAPGLDLDAASLRAVLNGAALEVELVSERGVCKEAVLWCGGLARADGARRASVIDHGGTHSMDGDPRVRTPLGPLDAFVGEPDAAVIRAGLIGAYCARTSACVLDERVAYITAPGALEDPFVRWYRVRDVLPFGVKRLRAYLHERSIGAVVVKTRAFPVQPDEILGLLKPRGDNEATIICTTIGGRKTAIVCGRASSTAT